MSFGLPAIPALPARRVLPIISAVLCFHPALRASDAPGFDRDIAPILSKHCLQCHRPGGISSFAPFTSYNAIRPWAKAIKEMVTLRQMPPWSADPDHSLKFRNDARLTVQEIAALRAWVDKVSDAGTPKQTDTEHLALPDLTHEWSGPNGRQPDLVISMPQEAHIPATGDLPYVRFLVKLPLAQDKWISASQARPGNGSIVHHMAITEVETPDGVSAADIDGLEAFYRKMRLATPLLQSVVGPRANPGIFDMLAIYTPGAAFEQYGDDSAKLLKGGRNRYIDFNIHYSANGTPATDRSEVAFWFRDTPPRHQIYRVAMSGNTILANGTELLTGAGGERAEGTLVAIPPIPPGAANYELIAVTPFPQPVTLFQLHPHAHFRAKDFQYVAVYPDGRKLILLTVPKYDFRWQLAYELANPLSLPAGSKLVVTAHYDNSANNKFNPAPEKTVSFRAQNLSTDEMFSPFVQYSVDTEDPANPDAKPRAPGAPLVQSVGCLVQTRNTQNWNLTWATDPIPSDSPASSAAEVNKAALLPPGNGTFQLVGLQAFQPQKYLGETVVVKGLQNGATWQLNVTSLLPTSKQCPQPSQFKKSK